MRFVRVGRPWLTILARRGDSTAWRDMAINGTAWLASFQKAEVVTGLVVGIGSLAIAPPGTVTRVPPASAVLLLPIAALLAYGVLILTGHARRAAAMPLQPHERRLIRRRTISWGAVTLVAMALPLEWVWPQFIGGLISIAYSLFQLRQLRRL